MRTSLDQVAAVLDDIATMKDQFTTIEQRVG